MLSTHPKFSPFTLTPAGIKESYEYSGEKDNKIYSQEILYIEIRQELVFSRQL